MPSSDIPVRRSVELFVGTYTERLPHVDGNAPGILRAGYSGHGRLGDPAAAATLRNPSWITVSGDVLYSVSETSAQDGQGSVAAYRIAADDSLTLLGALPSGGADPAHLALSPNRRHLLVANYSGGSVALFGLEERTGRITRRLDLARHAGTGPDPARQDAPHPHMVALDPLGGLVLVPDLGTDAVWTYTIEQDRLVPGRRIDCPAGTGPRHLAFHPSGDAFFLVGELANTLTVFHRTANGFTAGSTLPLLPGPRPGHSQAAAVRVTADGALVFVSNRGHDSITAFRNGPGNALRHAATVPAHGRAPRDLALTPDEGYLLTANQDSRSVSVFELDPGAADGKLLRFDHSLPAPTPVCLAWR